MTVRPLTAEERRDSLIEEAEIAVVVARQKEQWAVEAYATAYEESTKREEVDGGIILYATEDGWDKGPLPYALELSDGSDVDSADERWAVFLFRDGGPTCPRFTWESAKSYVLDGHDAPAGWSPSLRALAFVRQIVNDLGRISFLDGHQAAGLLLYVLDQED